MVRRRNWARAPRRRGDLQLVAPPTLPLPVVPLPPVVPPLPPVVPPLPVVPLLHQLVPPPMVLPLLLPLPLVQPPVEMHPLVHPLLVVVPLLDVEVHFMIPPLAVNHLLMNLQQALPLPPPGPWLWAAAGYQAEPILYVDGSAWLLPVDPIFGPPLCLSEAPVIQIE